MKGFYVLSRSPHIKAAQKHCRRASFSSVGKKCKCKQLLVPKDMGPYLVILRGYQPNASWPWGRGEGTAPQGPCSGPMGQERPLQPAHPPWLGVGILGLDKLFVPGPGVLMRDRSKGGHVMTVAGIRGMRPQGPERLQPSGAEEAGRSLLQGLQSQLSPAHTLLSDFRERLDFCYFFLIYIYGCVGSLFLHEGFL